MNIFKKFLRKIALSDFRAYVINNQSKHSEEIKQLKDQIFQSHPILILDNVRIYLPYFYVDHIQKIIYQTRDFYESITLNYLKVNYPYFKNIIEVGANIGNHLLFYTTQMQVEQVSCFEPNTFIREILEKNIELNFLENTVKVFPVALGATQSGGLQTTTDIKNSGMNKVIVAPEGAEKHVDILPLDYYHFDKIDFIKIDVEGHELEVLKGAEKTILNNKPVVMVEIFGNHISAAMQYFSSLGYVHKITIEEHNFIFEPQLING
jgi:FkbM family methyltransferase